MAITNATEQLDKWQKQTQMMDFYWVLRKKKQIAELRPHSDSEEATEYQIDIAVFSEPIVKAPQKNQSLNFFRLHASEKPGIQEDHKPIRKQINNQLI